MDNSSNMSSSAASNSETVGSIEPLKRKSDDIGWTYGELVMKDNLDKVKCKLCNKVVSGGIYRLKQHVAHIKGNVSSCTKSTPIDQGKCKQAIQEAKRKKEIKRDNLEELQNEVKITERTKMDDECVVEINGSSKMPYLLGPMDNFARSISSIDTSVDSHRKSRQQNINDTLYRSRTNEVHAYMAKWVYESGIPFNAVNNDANRMRDLVYVQFNSKLLNKKKKKENHDILLADDASMAQGWIVEGDNEDDMESQCSTNVSDEIFRDLDEDNFESEDEEVNEDFVFEGSDHEYW